MPKTLPLFGTFDLETDPFLRNREPRAFLAGAFDGSRHMDWWGPSCVEKLVDFLLRNPRVWYAHNGGKFDFHLLIPHIPRKRIKRLLCIAGRIVQIVFENDTQLEFRDSYALIPRPLRDWAKDDIAIEKLEADVRDKHRQEIMHYHKGDKSHLYDMLSAFFDSYGSHLTLASAAFKILHDQFDVPRVHVSQEFDAKFRIFYYAGRVEYYGLGAMGGGYTCVDINSSFPYSMTKPHWFGNAYVTKTRIPKTRLEQSFIYCEAESHGAFPYREESGALTFPDDGLRREFFVTGWEWQAAEELGLLVSAKVGTCFTPLETRDYANFVHHFMRIKEQADADGNKGERLFAKLLQNSGYGKFGQDPREFDEYMLRDWRDSPGDEWILKKDDERYGISIYTKPAQIMPHSFNNVCVAASVTGCSRALLLRARNACEGVAYCDTDSLIAKDVSRLPLGSKLGEWKIENTFSEFYIGGKKLYAGFDPAKINPHTGKAGVWKTASKGARLKPEQIIDVAFGKTVTYGFDAPSYSVKGPLRWTERRIRRADLMGKKFD